VADSRLRLCIGHGHYRGRLDEWSTDFLGVAEKGEMIMPTKSKIAALTAVAIVIAAPAFAGQRVKPTQHSAFDGAFASSANPGGAHVDPVQRPANNNLKADYIPARCPDFGISLDLPTRCWGRGL
jgi:hypothetical protein